MRPGSAHRSLELLPVSSIPFDASCQNLKPIGLFSADATFGELELYFVKQRYAAAGLGVILDFVAGAFPTS